jgi:hypothetical protein
VSEIPEPGSELPGVPPGIRRSQEAYWRDLPLLLKSWWYRGKWVAYHGEKRIGFGRSQAALYQKCFRLGLNTDEIYVDRVEPDEQPPWEPIEIEAGFEGPDDDDDSEEAKEAMLG